MNITYSLPPGLEGDIRDLERLIDACRKGEISAGELKAHRVPFGAYEQRERDTYMLRIRCAAGMVTPFQLEKVASLASEYGPGQVHLTTRQELQIHYVRLEDIPVLARKLAVLGLSSRGGGGNTVRNVTAQEDAGIDIDEVFDVTGYAVALTSRLIAEEDSWTLPRKFKIAFSGSARDKGYATIADLGFIAATRDGKKGFRVYAAGGMGARSQAGHLLFDFLPEDEVYRATRALKVLFWKYGNRKNKHAARLRFLWQSWGEEVFKEKFLHEFEDLKGREAGPLDVREIVNEDRTSGLEPVPIADASDFDLWKKRFVRPQKQKGLFSVFVGVELGFIDSLRLGKMARLLAPFGDNAIRMTKDQNILLRNIPDRHLGLIYAGLKDIVASFNRPLIFDRILSCAGAATCQLGICLSRGAAQAIIKTLAQDKTLDLDRVSDVKIHISGCPNSCGQHLAADLGFFGKAARAGTRLYPAYNVVAGAVIGDGKTQFAQLVGDVSARQVPGFVRDVLRLYLEKSGAGESFGGYLRAGGLEDLKSLVQRTRHVPDFDEDKNAFFDWGSDQPFSLAGRGTGECSAGLFDLIEIDLKNIAEVQKGLLTPAAAAAPTRQKGLLDLVFYASRMLLITRGIEPRTEDQIYEGFRREFIETGLISADLAPLITSAQNRDAGALLGREKDVQALAERVKFLYEHMDSAFHFNLPSAAPQATAGDAGSKPRTVRDLRGVACPMNFVKTKMELSRLKSKEILEVWLDDGEPIQNVPGSVREEGHLILEQKKTGDHWSVVIEKK